jgi:hypothetical protein
MWRSWEAGMPGGRRPGCRPGSYPRSGFTGRAERHVPVELSVMCDPRAVVAQAEAGVAAGLNRDERGVEPDEIEMAPAGAGGGRNAPTGARTGRVEAGPLGSGPPPR